MSTMIDEIFDRQYQSGRADLHAGIDRAVSSVGRSILTTFDAIQRIQFAAPWAPKRARKNRAGLA
jgi:hypothetical protein